MTRSPWTILPVGMRRSEWTSAKRRHRKEVHVPHVGRSSRRIFRLSITQQTAVDEASRRLRQALEAHINLPGGITEGARAAVESELRRQMTPSVFAGLDVGRPVPGPNGGVVVPLALRMHTMIVQRFRITRTKVSP